MSMRYQAGFLTASYFPLKVPDAPTIGTAGASNASASVVFTAPTNVGGGAITGYTATSSPGGFTGTGTSSPITVSGLSNGTAYTFTVVATNAYGTGPSSAASNSVTPANVVSSIELLTVAGGGGGGYNGNGGRGAGGGAGGLLYYGSETPKTPNGAFVSVSVGVSYAITVGAGGVPRSPSQTGNGVDSSFIGGAVSITSTGGGGGAYGDGQIGNTGGSAGGSWYTLATPAAGTTGQGNSGGTGTQTPSYGGGGGGGAGVAGGNGTTSTGGYGGDGLAYVISSASTYYAGGGSGDIYGVIGSNPGAPGAGGGGTGNNVSGGTNGGINTGGGGGSYNGSGGSGVVILRYADTFPAATSTTGSPTITVTGGYRIYKFTTSGSITF